MVKGIKRFFRHLTCRHDYESKYLHMVDGGCRKLYRFKCKKCGKVKYKSL